MNSQNLRELLNRHAAPLTLYARQWCAIPDDIVQEAFLGLVRQQPPPGNAVAWLYKVVRNLAINAGRSERRRVSREQQAGLLSTACFLSLDDRLDSRVAAESLQKLPEAEREAIIAHLWGNLSFEEIAEISGVSASTAHRRYLAGLKLLRERLGVACPRR